MALGEDIFESGIAGVTATGAAMGIYTEMAGSVWPTLALQVATLSAPGVVRDAAGQHNDVAAQCDSISSQLTKSQSDKLPKDLWSSQSQSAAMAGSFDPYTDSMTKTAELHRSIASSLSSQADNQDWIGIASDAIGAFLLTTAILCRTTSLTLIGAPAAAATGNAAGAISGRTFSGVSKVALKFILSIVNFLMKVKNLLILGGAAFVTRYMSTMDLKQPPMKTPIPTMTYAPPPKTA